MTKLSCNCIVCAHEYNTEDLSCVISSNQYDGNCKICKSCLSKCDPVDDYKQAKDIINCYIKIAYAKSLFKDVKSILLTRAQ
jgi:hypothetical protein